MQGKDEARKRTVLKVRRARTEIFNAAVGRYSQMFRAYGFFAPG